jgi:hypothetical protein
MNHLNLVIESLQSVVDQVREALRRGMTLDETKKFVNLDSTLRRASIRTLNKAHRAPWCMCVPHAGAGCCYLQIGLLVEAVFCAFRDLTIFLSHSNSALFSPAPKPSSCHSIVLTLSTRMALMCLMSLICPKEPSPLLVCSYPKELSCPRVPCSHLDRSCPRGQLSPTARFRRFLS